MRNHVPTEVVTYIKVSLTFSFLQVSFRNTYKIKENFWFVGRSELKTRNVIQFDVKINFTSPVIVEKIYLNGDVLCHKHKEKESGKYTCLVS